MKRIITELENKRVKSFKDFYEKEISFDALLVLPSLTVTKGKILVLKEGKTYTQNLSGKIRIDNPTHGVGQRHAHIYGRKGNEIGVVNIDGSPSHKSRFRLSKGDFEFLQDKGFNLKSRLVEWIVLEKPNEFLTETLA